ncbi:hypothetical protein Bca4012_027456 [Brassica carinata]
MKGRSSLAPDATRNWTNPGTFLRCYRCVFGKVRIVGLRLSGLNYFFWTKRYMFKFIGFFLQVLCRTSMTATMVLRPPVVVFDREMTKLIKHKTPTLDLEEVRFCSYTTVVMRLKLSQYLRLPLKPQTYGESGCGGQELPRCVVELAGKDCIFQIRVTPYPPQLPYLQVSAISDDGFFVTIRGKVNKQKR